MWIITFKVRSWAQSDQTRRVITTFTPVWPGFEPSFFSFFEKISIPPKNCCTPFFRSFLSVIFCSFPPPPLFFFHARVDLQAFENWSRVHNRVSDRRNYIRGSLLPAYLSARHQILIFLHEYDNDSPAPWTCLLQKLGGHRSPSRANRKRPRVSRSSARKRWLEGMVGGSRMNSKRGSRFLFAHRGRVQGIVYGSIL